MPTSQKHANFSFLYRVFEIALRGGWGWGVGEGVRWWEDSGESPPLVGELEILLGGEGGGLHKEYFQSSEAFVMLKLIFHLH